MFSMIQSYSVDMADCTWYVTWGQHVSHCFESYILWVMRGT